MMAREMPGVAVVVGADRHAAARVAIKSCGAEVILLDDGFQHRALARDCDIVLWDTLRPAEAMALLPRGLMREGLGALRRAHALVFTRANLGEPTRRILGRIKRIAPHLTIFHSSLVPHALYPLPAWNAGGESPSTTEPGTNETVTIASLQGAPLAAFCGLGNPVSFWRLIDETGARTVARHAFPDHYRPTAADLDAFLREAAAAGAQRVLITAKDAENLPDSWQPSLPVCVLTAQVGFGEDAERFWAFLTRAAEPHA
jgi:tetraacyldisaccharide 4'-kinase